MITLDEGVLLSYDEGKTMTGPMVRWLRKQMAGLKLGPLDSKALLTITISHYPQHQFTALIVDGIYKGYFLIYFCWLELYALLWKELTHASILCAMLGRKQVFWWAGSIYFSLWTFMIGFRYLGPLPLPHNLPIPGPHPALSITINSQVQGLLVIEISVPVSMTSNSLMKSLAWL